MQSAAARAEPAPAQWESWLSLITAFLPARVSNRRRNSIVTFVTEGSECDGESRGNITEALSDNTVIRQGMELSWWDQLSSGTQATISAVHVSAPVPATAALTTNLQSGQEIIWDMGQSHWKLQVSQSTSLSIINACLLIIRISVMWDERWVFIINQKYKSYS